MSSMAMISPAIQSLNHRRPSCQRGDSTKPRPARSTSISESLSYQLLHQVCRRRSSRFHRSRARIPL